MRRIQKGLFNLNDLRAQLENMEKMGGIGEMMSMLPGMAKFANQAVKNDINEMFTKRQIALIDSMTRQERANPKILQASRKKRIAAGSGMEVADLNRLLKMHRTMSDATKKMARGGMKSILASLVGGNANPDEKLDIDLPSGRGRANASRFAKDDLSRKHGEQDSEIPLWRSQIDSRGWS